MQEYLSADELEAAHDRIRGAVHRTPLFSSSQLGRRIDAPLFLKAENLQKTGSFKVRGALNKLTVLERTLRERGVVTVSAGNHAQALAWAARATKTPCTVVMPESAPKAKVRASTSYGARVILHGSVFDAFEHALQLAEEQGLTFVHPFDDSGIIAGQASVALEVLETLPDTGTFVVPVGGGGLIAGVAAAVHRLQPSARVYGVEPMGAAVMRKSLDEGRPARLTSVATIADGLGSPMAGDLTFPYVQAHVEDVVLVSDDEIRSAMTLLLSRTKLLTEPAGAAAVAALLTGRIPTPGRGGAPAVAILSGGNVDMERLAHMLTDEG